MFYVTPEVSQEIVQNYYGYMFDTLFAGEIPDDIITWDRRMEYEYEESMVEYHQRSEDYALYRQACIAAGDEIISFNEFCQL